MKKFLAILSLIAILGSTLPASADCEDGWKYRRHKMHPKHQRVVVNQYYGRNYYHPPVREVHYYHNRTTAGSVAGGILAGAIVGGIVAAIVD